jgi:hypothetical protein
VLVLALLAFAATVAIAAPPFGSPADVAPADRQALEASATFDSEGQLVVGWATLAGEESLLATARRSGDGSFVPGPAIASSSEELDGPQLASTPGGQTVATWAATDAGSGRGRIMASALSASGEVLGAVPISALADDASEPAIAAGPDGRIAVAWTVVDEDTGSGKVQAVHGTLGSQLTIRTVSAGDANAAEPDVAFDGAGVLQVAFSRFDDASDRVKVAAETPAGPFAPSRFVSPSGVDAAEASISAAPDGGLAIAWTEQAGATESVKVGVEPAPGAPIASVGVPGGGTSSGARLAVDPAAGTLTVAWIRSLSGADSALVATRTTGGAIEAPQVVSGGDRVTAVTLAFSTAGNAALIWRRELGTATEPAGDIRAALFDAPRDPAPGPLPVPVPVPLPPPPPPPPSSPSSAPSPVPLTLTDFGVDPTCIRYGTSSNGKPTRLSFSFALSEAASVRLTVQRRLNSRVQDRCPTRSAPGEPGRLGSPIVVDVVAGAGPLSVRFGDEAGSFARAARGRRDGATVSRRMSSGRRRIVLQRSSARLRPGTYVARATAASSDGRRSATLKIKFWVLGTSRKP